MMKKFLCLLLCLFGFFAFAGCGNDKKPEAAAPQKVTLGMLRLTSSAPLFIAMERGYFAEENLDVTPQWFDAAQPIAVACASSKIDVGATGITAGLYNMAAKGQKLYLVADKGREQKGYPSSALMAGRAAYEAGLVGCATCHERRGWISFLLAPLIRDEIQFLSLRRHIVEPRRDARRPHVDFRRRTSDRNRLRRVEPLRRDVQIFLGEIPALHRNKKRRTARKPQHPERHFLRRFGRFLFTAAAGKRKESEKTEQEAKNFFHHIVSLFYSQKYTSLL